MKKFLIVALLLGVSLGVMAKSPAHKKSFTPNYIVGLNFLGESNITFANGVDNSYFAPNFGASFEGQMSTHSGFETGIYYRSESYTMPIKGMEVSNLKNSYHYLSIPLLYKFYSRILCFAVGLNYDVMVGNNDELASQQNGPQGDANRLGLMVKLTKDIHLTDNLILEPSLHFNPYLSQTSGFQAAWLGFGLGVKYSF
ncbi:MAG: hypothetical protein RSC07_01540 [Mucinivorans sp.]